MKAGHPLNDADRAPWLAAIGQWIDGWQAAGEGGVITCSALKQAYRDTLTEGRPQVRIVYIRLTHAVAAERVANRKGHFMPPSLLDSQFADLQQPAPDEGAVTVDGTLKPDDQVTAIVDALQQSAPNAGKV
jgi:carbohydrate kinase (thermoresistant glucokinase family)